MTDYTKPVGWWCIECEQDLPQPCAYSDTVEHCCGHTTQRHRSIPKFKPLPTPEPTTWGESGGDEAVCFVLEADGSFSYLRGGNRYPHVWGLDDELWALDSKEYGTRLEDGDLSTAIRHVAEE